MKLILVLLAVLIIGGCGKEKPEHPNCDNLRAGIAEGNEYAVKLEIEKLTVDLEPHPNSEDDIGHNQNLFTLASRINEDCPSILAEVDCYACLESFPVKSKINVSFEQNGNIVEAGIYIITPENDVLLFGGLINE